MTRAIALLVLLALPIPAGAVTLHYEAYAAGLNVLDMDADFDVQPDRYRVALDVKAVGALGAFSSSHTRTTVEGRFVSGRPVPQRFYSAGVMRGENRVTQIEYVNGQPAIRQLVPPNEKEREDVPPAQQRDTVDTLSAMAELMHQVNTTRRCEGQTTTFDGRRLATLAAHTSGEQPLEATGRSSYAGPTLRCEFRGQMLAGFKADEDRAEQQKPQQGTAWFAPLSPGGPLVPVRVTFHTKWFGDATMYLAQPGAQPRG